MATFYWVGGAGTWNTSTTTNWASSTGGAGGAGVPTSADNVIIDTLSGTGTITCTAGVCNDLTVTASQAIILGAASSTLSIFGSMTLPSGGSFSASTNSNTITFAATTTGKTITTNGKTLFTVTFNGVGGEWTLGSAFSIGNRNLTITNGSFNTGNYNVTAHVFASNNSNVRSITLGSSTLDINGSITAWNISTTTNLTFNAGTSTINLLGNDNGSTVFNGGSLTYYNVAFTQGGLVTATTTGANTFNNLTFASRGVTGTGLVTFNGNQTINGTLDIMSANTTEIRRLRFFSDVFGTARTITAAAVSIGAGVDFRNITAAGAAAPFNVSAKNVGDCGGNTNITFPVAKTVYRKGTGDWSATQWASTQAGAPAADQFPLAQDTMVFTADTTTGTHTINAAWQLGTLNMTNSTTVTLASGTVITNVYGNVTLSNAVTLSGTGTLIFSGPSNQSITSSGRTFTQIIQITTVNSVQLADALISLQPIVVSQGNFDLNNLTATCSIINSDGTVLRSIAFGTTGKISVTGNANTVVNFGTPTNFSYTGTSNIELTYSGGTGTRGLSLGVNAGNQFSEANALNIRILSGSDVVALGFSTVVSRFRNLIFENAFTGTFGDGGASNGRWGECYGDLRLSPSMSLNILSFATPLGFIGTSGTQQFTSSGKTISRGITKTGASTLQLQDNATTPDGFTFNSGTIDLTGNSGNWTLTALTFASSNANVRSIVFGTGNITLTGTVWDTSTATNFSRTGTPTVNISNNSATATIVATGAMTEAQALNFNYTTGTYTLTDTAAVYRSVNFTGFAGTIPNSVRTIFGGLTLSTGMTLTAGANATTFASTSAGNTITSAGKTQNYPIIFNGIGGVWACQDALTQGSTRAFTITNGTVQLKNGVTSTVGVFATSGTNQKFLQSTTPGSQATLSQASGTVDASYLTIQDINATGGATWNALWSNNNVDSGDNTGWFFGDQPIINAVEYTYKLRSFTQPRRF